MAERILVVEDDPTIWRGLQHAFVQEGYDVICANTGRHALAAAVDRPPDLVLVDLGLPDVDGIELCHRLRKAVPDTTIVILTARSAEIDMVLGLDAGADDYVVKPFKLAVLRARVRAHLRRRPKPTGAVDHLEVDELAVDLTTRRVTVAGEEVRLRKKEFDLLVMLVSEAGRVVTRERMMAEVWDDQWVGSTKTLDVQISSLRRRLGAVGERITTLRGVGHRLERAGSVVTSDAGVHAEG